jgi:hypothetical protein
LAFEVFIFFFVYFFVLPQDGVVSRASESGINQWRCVAVLGGTFTPLQGFNLGVEGNAAALDAGKLDGVGVAVGAKRAAAVSTCAAVPCSGTRSAPSVTCCLPTLRTGPYSYDNVSDVTEEACTISLGGARLAGTVCPTAINPTEFYVGVNQWDSVLLPDSAESLITSGGKIRIKKKKK